MDDDFNKLKEAVIEIVEISNREIKRLSDEIDRIIDYKIIDERIISSIFDSILSIVFIDDNEKRKVFHKLSNYCRNFNKELADDYDEILESDLADNFEEEVNNNNNNNKIRQSNSKKRKKD